MCKYKAEKLLIKTKREMTIKEISKKIGCSYRSTARAVKSLYDKDKSVSLSKKKTGPGNYTNLYKIRRF